MSNNGPLAEWLGGGLQNRKPQFESGMDLKVVVRSRVTSFLDNYNTLIIVLNLHCPIV